MVRNGCQGVTPSNLLQPFLVSFNPCLSFFTFFNAKPPSLDLVGEIVHGSTDLLSMSRWGGGGTPLVQMLRQKKIHMGVQGAPFGEHHSPNSICSFPLCHFYCFVKVIKFILKVIHLQEIFSLCNFQFLISPHYYPLFAEILKMYLYQADWILDREL